MKTGDQLIAEERCKQLREFNFDATHDQQWKNAELLRAASCYLSNALHTIQVELSHTTVPYVPYTQSFCPQDWPWNPSWWKPESPEKDMIKAAALIAAEYDRRNS